MPKIATAVAADESPWLDAKEAAAYLKTTERQFRERVSVQPGFPKARNKTGLRLLWLRRELDAWVLNG